MRALPTADQWRRLDAALDRLLDLPAPRREDEIARLAGDDDAFARELRALAAHLDDEEFLSGPALPAGVGAADGAAPDGLRAGARIGDWCLDAPLGRGGMGEVWSAQRADGQYEQSVAIKVMRPEARAHWARFEAERRILARLEHPGIARLLDGGVTDDGRPYMVMERVDGEPITRWCARRASPLAERIDVWLQVAEAVQSAHQQLVVHRDLKPANVLVGEDGRVKLLDFGIARLLDDTTAAPTLGAPMTPGWAAPEQWRGETAGVATDVYALGLLGYELLAGGPPFGPCDAPLALSLQRVLTETAPLASRTARERSGAGSATATTPAPVPPRALAGDLDAILARCLRTEPADRYGSVRELIDDLHRHLRHEPVRARAGARWYVVARALRRHRLPLAAGLLVVVVSTTAALGMAWQAREARRSADQAHATKAFLLSLFKANDARVAQDRPRGSITARELLDQNADRIEREFAGQPELEIELLATVRDLYGYLDEDERFEHFQKRTMALATAHYGEHHPIVIGGVITDAWGSIYAQDYAGAAVELARADRLLHEAGLDESALRAEWWLAHGESLRATPGGAMARLADNERAAPCTHASTRSTRCARPRSPTSPTHASGWAISRPRGATARMRSRSPRASATAPTWTSR
jgi:predicted Ser/Thr protein kinase